MKLHVVRQTVSKWEKGLSVPDADVLIRMAEILDVPVSKLLGTKEKDQDMENLTEALARLNEELAIRRQKEVLVTEANNKRNQILFFSFLAMMVALIVKNEILSIILVGICLLTAIIVLYRNLALLTSVTTDDLRIRTLKITTIFNAVILIIGITVSILIGENIISLSENGEKLFAMILVSGIILFGGFISPKLPFTRHTGLRLPWTVRDEDTWDVAHRIIGYISLPIVLLYWTAAWTISDFEKVSMVIVLTWIGIPGVLSYIYFWKKMHGKR